MIFTVKIRYALVLYDITNQTQFTSTIIPNAAYINETHWIPDISNQISLKPADQMSEKKGLLVINFCSVYYIRDISQINLLSFTLEVGSLLTYNEMKGYSQTTANYTLNQNGNLFRVTYSARIEQYISFSGKSYNLTFTDKTPTKVTNKTVYVTLMNATFDTVNTCSINCPSNCADGVCNNNCSNDKNRDKSGCLCTNNTFYLPLSNYQNCLSGWDPNDKCSSTAARGFYSTISICGSCQKGYYLNQNFQSTKFNDYVNNNCIPNNCYSNNSYSTFCLAATNNQIQYNSSLIKLLQQTNLPLIFSINSDPFFEDTVFNININFPIFNNNPYNIAYLLKLGNSINCQLDNNYLNLFQGVSVAQNSLQNIPSCTLNNNNWKCLIELEIYDPCIDGQLLYVSTQFYVEFTNIFNTPYTAALNFMYVNNPVKQIPPPTVCQNCIFSRIFACRIQISTDQTCQNPQSQHIYNVNDNVYFNGVLITNPVGTNKNDYLISLINISLKFFNRVGQIIDTYNVDVNSAKIPNANCYKITIQRSYLNNLSGNGNLVLYSQFSIQKIQSGNLMNRNLEEEVIMLPPSSTTLTINYSSLIQQNRNKTTIVLILLLCISSMVLLTIIGIITYLLKRKFWGKNVKIETENKSYFNDNSDDILKLSE